MHDVCHVEFMTRDMARLVEFYKDLFGWKKTMDSPTYAVLSPKEGPAVGFAAADDETPSPMITNYILVKDIESTLENVRARGLEIVMQKTEVPNMGWFALFKDPDGNVMGLWTSVRRPAVRESGAQAATKTNGRPTKKAARKGTKKAAPKAARRARRRS